jgi:ABC-type uncharacterized transport system involved in gliding motility auxiliary subunit
MNEQNSDFLIQAADWLCKDDDIIGIRNRLTRSGRLDKIIDPGKRAAAIRSAQVINVFLIPLLVVFGGIILAFLRGKKARAAEPGSRTASTDKNNNTKECPDDV